MPDISMCLNKECPLKDNCYRYVAKPSEFRQSYSEFKYNNGCDYYWEFVECKSNVCIKDRENEQN